MPTLTPITDPTTQKPLQPVRQQAGVANGSQLQPYVPPYSQVLLAQNQQAFANSPQVRHYLQMQYIAPALVATVLSAGLDTVGQVSRAKDVYATANQALTVGKDLLAHHLSDLPNLEIARDGLAKATTVGLEVINPTTPVGEAWNQALQATKAHPTVGAWFNLATTQVKALLDQPLTQSLGALAENTADGIAVRQKLLDKANEAGTQGLKELKNALTGKVMGNLAMNTLTRHVPLGIAVGLGAFSLNKMLLQPQNPVTQWFKELLPANHPANWQAPTVTYQLAALPADATSHTGLGKTV